MGVLCQLGASQLGASLDVRCGSGCADARRAIAQDDRLIRSGGPRGLGGNPQATMATQSRGARCKAQWPGARMLQSVGGAFEAVTALFN
jgi:hypothetical protein